MAIVGKAGEKNKTGNMSTMGGGGLRTRHFFPRNFEERDENR